MARRGGRRKESGSSSSLEAGECHPFLPGLAGGVSFGHNGMDVRPGTELPQQHSSQRHQGGTAPDSQPYRPPQPAPLDEVRPDR